MQNIGHESRTSLGNISRLENIGIPQIPEPRESEARFPTGFIEHAHGFTFFYFWGISLFHDMK